MSNRREIPVMVSGVMLSTGLLGLLVINFGTEPPHQAFRIPFQVATGLVYGGLAFMAIHALLESKPRRQSPPLSRRTTIVLMAASGFFAIPVAWGTWEIMHIMRDPEFTAYRHTYSTSADVCMNASEGGTSIDLKVASMCARGLLAQDMQIVCGALAAIAFWTALLLARAPRGSPPPYGTSGGA
jgi:hypothetical protein